MRLVKEGFVELELPEDERLDRVKGPQRAGARMVFYNPAAKATRDVTVGLLRALPAPEGGWRILDALCGSGVRGLRIALEVDRVSEVVLNDGDPAAAALAAKQVERLGLKTARVSNRSTEEVLADRSLRFDLIDLDPYGSPVRFLTAAAQRTTRAGLVAATATDVGTLCGAFATACVRRHGAAPLHNESMKETAARILVGAAARKAGAVERTITPLVTFCAEHYIRVMYRVAKGKGGGEAASNDLGFLKWPNGGAPRAVSFAALQKDPEALSGEGAVAGPLWLGPLHDTALLQSPAFSWPLMFAEKSPSGSFLLAARDELAAPPWHFDLDVLASSHKFAPPRTERTVEALKERGFAASRTHFSPKAVKTSASPAELAEVVRTMGPKARRP